MRNLLASLLAAVATGFGVTSSALAQEPRGADPQADLTELVRGNNEFAFDLYARLSKKEGNLVFSPYSISSALAMTYAGARGKTADEMAKALHFTLPQERLHPAFAALTKQLQARTKPDAPEVVVANALWGQKGFPFEKDFLRLTADHYGAGFREADFQRDAEGARRDVNRWVSVQTRDKIRELLPPGSVDDSSRLVLTNAAYLKADWMSPFDKDLTLDVTFHRKGNDPVKVPMMRQNRDLCLRYLDAGDCQLLELPYGCRDLVLVILLPKKMEGLPQVEATLTGVKVTDWCSRARVQNVVVILPKFQMTTAIRVKSELQGLGMGFPFTEQAEFSGISSEKVLRLKEVVHQTQLDVDEKGTEAAAATVAIIAVPTSGPPEERPVVFQADHPFLFLVRDRRNGSTLFMGRVTDPKRSE